MVSEDDRLTGWAVVIVNFYRNVGHRLGLTTRTQISVCKSPISFCRHRSVSVPCENSSAETTVAEGGRNPVAGLWGRTLSENWPPEPTFSYASIDFWCQLVASPATAIPETAKQRLSSIHANSSTDTYLWDRAECIRQYTSEAAHSKETYICRVSVLAVPVHIS